MPKIPKLGMYFVLPMNARITPLVYADLAGSWGATPMHARAAVYTRSATVGSFLPWSGPRAVAATAGPGPPGRRQAVRAASQERYLGAESVTLPVCL